MRELIPSGMNQLPFHAFRQTFMLERLLEALLAVVA